MWAQDFRQKTVANLEAMLGWEDLASQDVDFVVRDIWGIFRFLCNLHSYLFVGGRGAGKTTLASQAVNLCRSGEYARERVVVAMNCASVSSVGEKAEAATIQKFIALFFEKLLAELRLRKQAEYQKLRRISSTYALWRKWQDFRSLERQVERFSRRDISTLRKLTNIIAQSRLRLSIDVASFRFSLLDAGPLRVGSVDVSPLTLTFAREGSGSFLDVGQLTANLDDEMGDIEAVLIPLMRNLIPHLLSNNVKRIFVILDDFHFLPVPSQVRIIHFLRRVVAQLEGQGISMVFKIFSATNLTPYIRGVLGLLNKEIAIRNIESSLENLEDRRIAITSLLKAILRKTGWEDSMVRHIFTQRVINWLLVFSGGHPRRFLEMCTKYIEITAGEPSLFYDEVTLAAASVLSEYHQNFIAQLGIEKDPLAREYQRVYMDSIKRVAEKLVDFPSPFILVEHHDLQTNMAFAQWIDDAVAIGDLLEIDGNRQVGGRWYKLFTVNPVTLHLYGGSRSFRQIYHHIDNIQHGVFTDEIPRLPSEI